MTIKGTSVLSSRLTFGEIDLEAVAEQPTEPKGRWRSRGGGGWAKHPIDHHSRPSEIENPIGVTGPTHQESLPSDLRRQFATQVIGPKIFRASDLRFTQLVLVSREILRELKGERLQLLGSRFG